MKVISKLTVIGVMYLIMVTLGCNNQSSEDVKEGISIPGQSELASAEPMNIASIDTSNTIVETKKNENSSSSQKIVKKKLRVSKAHIDSLNKIIPAPDLFKYDEIIIDYFTSLSSELNGRPFYIENADEINKTLLEILSTRLNNQTDIVLLIDKTGSMEDDWVVVRNSLSEIMEFLKGFKDVRLGIASYGDKNYHHDFWYNMEDLSYDIDKLQDFMDTYSTMGNPDARESVNDAIIKTVDSMSWNPNSNRMLIVIGDAPSQNPPLSDYSLEEVITHCKSQNVIFNLYPVIINSFLRNIDEPPVKTDIARFYPNPVFNNITIETNSSSLLTYEIIDLTGKVLKKEVINSRPKTIDLSNLPKGTYLINIFNEDLTEYFSDKIIKK